MLTNAGEMGVEEGDYWNMRKWKDRNLSVKAPHHDWKKTLPLVIQNKTHSPRGNPCPCEFDGNTADGISEWVDPYQIPTQTDPGQPDFGG